MAKVNHGAMSTLEQGTPLPGVAKSRAADVFAQIGEFPADRQVELSEIIEDMLNEEEDRRDIEARRKLVRRARAQLP